MPCAFVIGGVFDKLSASVLYCLAISRNFLAVSGPFASQANALISHRSASIKHSSLLFIDPPKISLRKIPAESSIFRLRLQASHEVLEAHLAHSRKILNHRIGNSCSGSQGIGDVLSSSQIGSLLDGSASILPAINNVPLLGSRLVFLRLNGLRPLGSGHGGVDDTGHGPFVLPHGGPELLDKSWVIHHVRLGFALYLEPNGDRLGETRGYLRLGLDFPADSRAIATACFWGLPSFTSLLIFLDTTFWDDPLAKGIDASTRL